MRETVSKVAVIGPALVLFLTPVVFAQSSQAAAAKQEQVKARYNVSIMEGVLEAAVTHGAQNLIQRIKAVAPGDVLLLAGTAEVRGYQLEGYGLFFDVEVPMLRQSVAWTLRALIDQNGVPLGVALQELRTYVRSVQDPQTKESLEGALRRIELQVGPTSAAAPDAAPASASGAPVISADALTWLSDPAGAYTSEVKKALVDAVLEHSGTLGIEADEWLTVAARDNERRDRLNPGDDVRTIIIRVKGNDLTAFLSGRITLDEARKRVEVREY